MSTTIPQQYIISNQDIRVIMENVVPLQVMFYGPDWVSTIRKNAGRLPMCANQEYNEFLREIRPLWIWYNNKFTAINYNNAICELVDTISFMALMAVYKMHRSTNAEFIVNWDAAVLHTGNLISDLDVNDITIDSADYIFVTFISEFHNLEDRQHWDDMAASMRMTAIIRMFISSWLYLIGVSVPHFMKAYHYKYAIYKERAASFKQNGYYNSNECDCKF